jgi:hypothetical protein
MFGDRLSQARFELRPDLVYFGIEGELGKVGVYVASARADSAAESVRYVVEALWDWLPTTDLFWGERAPLCPLHPGAHPLDVDIAGDEISLSCPVEGQVVRQLPIGLDQP